MLDTLEGPQTIRQLTTHPDLPTVDEVKTLLGAVRDKLVLNDVEPVDVAGYPHYSLPCEWASGWGTSIGINHWGEWVVIVYYPGGNNIFYFNGEAHTIVDERSKPLMDSFRAYLGILD